MSDPADPGEQPPDQSTERDQSVESDPSAERDRSADQARVDPEGLERLNPRVRIVWVVAATVRAVVVGAVLLGGASLLAGPEGIVGAEDAVTTGAGALAALYAIVRVVHAWLRYGAWRFQVRDDALYIERGVFTRVKTVAPYVRVQHVDSRRGPIERAVGLATVVVYTAGSRSADVAIPGLTPERAEDLREELRRLAIVSEGDDAV